MPLEESGKAAEVMMPEPEDLLEMTETPAENREFRNFCMISNSKYGLWQICHSSFYALTRFLEETVGRSNGRAPQEGECKARRLIGWRLRRNVGSIYGRQTQRRTG